jgi:hypothetical protein
VKELIVIRVRLTILISGVFTLLFAGCGGPSLKPASGTVTYKGAPVEGASVVFSPVKGPLGNGTTDASGKYTISTEGKPGAMLGKHEVMISKFTSPTTVPGGGTSPQDMINAAKAKGDKGKTASGSKSAIPTKYSTPKSGLTAEVTADTAKNVFDFTLTD